MRRLVFPYSFAVVLLLHCGMPHVGLAQANWGALQGVVSDLTGGVIPGAQVGVEGGSLPRGISAATDAFGRYSFPSVAVGRYTVTVSAPGFHTLRYHNLDIRLGGVSTFNARMALGAVTDSVEVNDSLQALDTTSLRTITHITASEFDNLARGRNFHTLLMMAPGVRHEARSGASGVGGFTVDGASGSENTYYIDGVEVSDVLSGALRQQYSVPFEFVKAVQVQSGGFEAEFGGATGGAVSVATRSGTNQFHGEATAHIFSGLFNAGDRGYWQRSAGNANLAEYLLPKKDDYRVLYPGISLGGPVLRNRIFGFLSYMPEFDRTSRTIDYADGTRNFRNQKTRQYLLNRLDASLSSKLQLSASWVWSPVLSDGALPVRDARMVLPANFSNYREFVPAQTLSVSGTYSPASRTVITSRFGYKYSNGRSNAYGVSQSPMVNYRTPTAAAPGVPDELAGVAGFATTSGSFLVDRDITTRTSFMLDASHVTNIFGQQHIFKAGYQVNRIFNDVSDGYANGRFDVFWGETFSRANVVGQRGRYGYYIWEDGPRTLSRASGRNHALYLQDTWRALPTLTVNAGVRIERELLPPYAPEYQGIAISNPVEFGWGDKVAPRLGASWDVRGDGRWKLSGSTGLFYDLMKYSLARAAFGGVRWLSHAYALDDPNVLGLSLKNPGALGTPLMSWDNRAMPINQEGKWEGIDPNLRPFTSREMSLTLDRRLTSRLNLSVRYVRKDLLRTVEDIGVLDANQNEVYLIGNPGFGLTRTAGSAYGGKTPDGKEWLVPEAKRRYDALEVRVQGDVRRVNVLASYTMSRLWGNFAGLANSDEAGRMDPGISRSFDLPTYYFDSTGSQRNVFGRLATDRPHVFKLFAWRELAFGAKGTTAIGLTQQAMSGGLDSTTVTYLTAPTFPNGRGDMGRLPVMTQSDLNLTHTVRIRERMSMKFEATAMNVLNQAAVTSRATQINRAGNISSSQLPWDQFFGKWDVNQFVFPGSRTPAYNPIYGLPGADPADGGVMWHSGKSDYSSSYLAQNPQFGAYQGPRTVRLGVRLIF
ncbi:MAG: carboxypeptidase regulatory-like domain-containing protein [Bryobacteraceae bacterium]|nr:carboxypeptidase regulatory-like domain-containing protein [Bryobacteraceae bacterium]